MAEAAETWIVRIDVGGLDLPDEILGKLRSISVSLTGPEGDYAPERTGAARHSAGAQWQFIFNKPAVD